MIRAVFDTNVFVSALFTPNRRPAKLLEIALQGQIRLIVSLFASPSYIANVYKYSRGGRHAIIFIN
jgi:predicted nucleic acid-binding protein